MSDYMGHRERVLAALDHREPDRLPIDLGSSVVTSIAASTYQRLRAFLKLPDRKTRIAEVTQQIACVDTDLLEIIGADILPVWPNPPARYLPAFESGPDGSTTFKDEFGATLKKPLDGFYYDWVEFPLPEPSIEDMEAMNWPDPEDPARYAGLRERALDLRRQTDYALFGMAPTTRWEVNELVRDHYRLELPADRPAGDYQIFVGFYSAEGAQNLDVLDGMKNAQGQRFLLARITLP